LLIAFDDPELAGMFLRKLRHATMVAVGKAQELILDFDGLDRPEGSIHPQLGDF
jgi:hypothetical protein